MSMLIAGTHVSVGAVAKLGLQLHRAGYKALAGYIGHAIDHHHRDVGLDQRDYLAVIHVLELDPIPELEPIRARMLEELQARRSS